MKPLDGIGLHITHTHCSQNTRTRPTAGFSFYLFFIPSMCLIYLRLFRIANVPHNEKPDESSKFPFCYPGICIYTLVILSNVQTPFLYMQRPELFVLYILEGFKF